MHLINIVAEALLWAEGRKPSAPDYHLELSAELEQGDACCSHEGEEQDAWDERLAAEARGAAGSKAGGARAAPLPRF